MAPSVSTLLGSFALGSPLAATDITYSSPAPAVKANHFASGEYFGEAQAAPALAQKGKGTKEAKEDLASPSACEYLPTQRELRARIQGWAEEGRRGR